MKRIVLSLLISFNAFSQTLVFLGDSLTEGYGIDPDKAYPRLVEEKFHQSGRKEIKCINAGISGSTTASASSRLEWFFKAKPSHLIIALGANDGRRGVKVAESKKNLKAIIGKAQKAELSVFLAEMKLPYNYGEKYRQEFEKMYQELAKEFKIEMIPFILQNVATKKELNLADTIHPNEKGHAVIAQEVYEFLKERI